MKYFPVFICFLSFYSCRTKHGNLVEYYRQTSNNHHRVADSLMIFSNRYNTNMILRKWQDEKKTVAFMVQLHRKPEYVAVEFDSSFLRKDPNPEETAKMIIPLDIIRTFKSSPYLAIKADSNQVFFGQNFSSDGNSQYGVLITKRTLQKSEYIMKIDSFSYLSKEIIQ